VVREQLPERPETSEAPSARCWRRTGRGDLQPHCASRGSGDACASRAVVRSDARGVLSCRGARRI